jgi:protein TonB
VMLELAPLPATPASASTDAEVARKLNETLPDPQEPPPVDLKPMKIEVETAEAPPPVKVPLGEVVPPPPEPPPPLELKPPAKPVEKPRSPQPQPRAAAAAPRAAPEPAPTAAAPALATTPAPPSAGLSDWKGVLLRHLERHKRYPQEAQRARHEGVAIVRFVMSRDGRVLSVRVERTSGIASLDQEGLDLLQRAQPLPALPPDQPGDSLELVVPLQFRFTR